MTLPPLHVGLICLLKADNEYVPVVIQDFTADGVVHARNLARRESPHFEIGPDDLDRFQPLGEGTDPRLTGFFARRDMEAAVKAEEARVADLRAKADAAEKEAAALEAARDPELPELNEPLPPAPATTAVAAKPADLP